MALLLVELARITGGSPPSTSALSTHSEATTLWMKVVLPVPGGPLRATTSPSFAANMAPRAWR